MFRGVRENAGFVPARKMVYGKIDMKFCYFSNCLLKFYMFLYYGRIFRFVMFYYLKNQCYQRQK